MVTTRVIEETHEGEVVSIAYNKQRREIYTAADGDKIIKVRCTNVYTNRFSFEFMFMTCVHTRVRKEKCLAGCHFLALALLLEILQLRPREPLDVPDDQ